MNIAVRGGREAGRSHDYRLSCHSNDSTHELRGISLWAHLYDHARRIFKQWLNVLKTVVFEIVREDGSLSFRNSCMNKDTRAWITWTEPISTPYGTGKRWYMEYVNIRMWNFFLSDPFYEYHNAWIFPTPISLAYEHHMDNLAECTEMWWSSSMTVILKSMSQNFVSTR